MSFRTRWNYYRRVFAAYVGSNDSQLTFWHETPELNERFQPGRLGEYYMPFREKADYRGPYDVDGIPLLDYHGAIGLQYNPIAIAQYGLGNYNLYRQSQDADRRAAFLRAADWLVSHLEANQAGLAVWNHHFDWDYRTTLEAPWYSGLAQGQGISLLVRAHQATGDALYLDAARQAFQPLLVGIDEGGVSYVDERGHVWIEEYVVSPPTHVLNGFVWALWGVYDYGLATGDSGAEKLFADCVETLTANLGRYDAGFWSLYEQSDTRLEMLASPFYHHLHVVQLKVMARITAQSVFESWAMRWDSYRHSRINRARALTHKSIFKLCYY